MKGSEFDPQPEDNVFSHLPKDKAGLGYTMLPSHVVCALFEEMRGGNNDDNLVVLTFRDGEDGNREGRILQASNLSGRAIDQELGMQILALVGFVEEVAPQDLGLTGVAVVTDGDGYSAAYVRGERGVVAVGYDDSMRCPKGTMMAVLLMYAFAQVNCGFDEELFRNAFNYLPFDPGVGLDWHFFEFADAQIAGLAAGQLAGAMGDEWPDGGPQHAGELLEFPPRT